MTSWLRSPTDGENPQPNPAWTEADGDLSSSSAPYKIYNIGNNNPEKLGYFIEVLERRSARSPKRIPADAGGDVPRTYADVSDLARDIDFKPRPRSKTASRLSSLVQVLL
jgi:UDP-glucuronate 4-epimerase